MLRVVHSNRAEGLLSALLEALPPADPFAPETIVVGGHLVARWLRREIAIARGIAAGLELVTFDRFVEATWGADAGGLAGLDQRQLAAAIASVLADGATVARLPAVQLYLDADGDHAGGDRGGPRRVQLAEHVAQLAWQYALTRPEWMQAAIDAAAPGPRGSSRGREVKLPAELADDSTAHWQLPLIAAALRNVAGRVPVPMLPWARRRAGQPAPVLARPLHVVGASYLQRAQLDALSDLATTTDVTVYLLDPCAELWDDVSGRGAPRTGIDPLPLTLWGRAVRDTLGALVERTGGDFADAFVETAPRSAREQLLVDMLHRHEPTVTPGQPPGVRVLACPDARRELEIVAAKIRTHLDADPTLQARDVAVWIASDAERYLAQAPAAFEAVGVPAHLIDAPLDDRGRIGEAVLALLDLPTSTMARRDLLRVMTHPALLAAHPHVQPEDWVRWTERLGIVHGADHSAHANTYLAAHPGQFHWDQGVRRLALGAFMLGRDRGPVQLGDQVLIPEEVRPEQHASAATYALLVRSLCADAAWLLAHEATLAEWADVLVGLVDTYLARTTEEAERDVERVRAMLAGIAHVDLDGRRVGFREAREHAIRRLATARADRGEPLASGVTVVPLTAMRALPFRIGFVIGLAEGAFPAGDQPSALDLRREVKPGDVAPRDRDRHAFLEVLLGTRDALYLSYVAVEPKSAQPVGPSSVVLELADALAPYVCAPADAGGAPEVSSRAALEALTERHPLHRFTGTGELPPAIVRERWAVRVRDALRAHLRGRGFQIPDEDGLLAQLAHPALAPLREQLGLVDAPPPAEVAGVTRPVSLANLRAFLEHPVQAWAQAVLGLDELPDDGAIEHSDEPFHVDAPVRALLLREVLSAQLRDPAADVGALYDQVVRDLELRGQFPVGVFGEAARANDLRTLAAWRRELGPVAVGAATRLAFGRSSSPAADLRPALDLELAPGRTVRLVGQTELLLADGDRFASVVPLVSAADKRGRHHLRGAIDHLVLAAAGIAQHGHVHVLLGSDGKALRVEHVPWTAAEARAYLAGVVRELLDAPHGYLLPFDQLVRAFEGKPLKLDSDPQRVVGYGPIDRIDGLALPDDVVAIAERRLRPLVERMRGDHLFGGRA